MKGRNEPNSSKEIDFISEAEKVKHSAFVEQLSPYLEEVNWRILIESIRKGNCILLLGPDAATEDVNGKRRSLTELLAEELARELSLGVRSQINTSDLAQVTQCCRFEKKCRDFLEFKVWEFYNSRRELTSELHENLADLPFYFVLTTTPDRMLYNALQGKNKSPNTAYYNFNGKNPDMVKEMGTVKSPLIFYLYGSTDRPDSLMLSESDILDFLEHLISKKRPLPDNIRSELRNENKNFLFIGFGFRHWYLRLLLHVLRGRNNERRSIAMEELIPEYPAAFKQTIFFFRNSDYNIHIFNYGISAFVKKLRDQYEEIERETRQQVPVIADTDINKPKVFICHASEDTQKAEFLYKKFKEGGLKPWLDKYDLKHADKWRKVIQREIENCDYFVVLLSPHIKERSIDFVNLEIAYARQCGSIIIGKSPNFILPIKIEDFADESLLRSLQLADIQYERIELNEGGYDKERIDNLIKFIKADFNKPRI